MCTFLSHIFFSCPRALFSLLSLLLLLKKKKEERKKEGESIPRFTFFWSPFLIGKPFSFFIDFFCIFD